MKRRHIIPIMLATAFLSLTVSACAQYVDVPVVSDNVSEVSLSLPEVEISINEETILEAFVSTLDGKKVDVMWRSSDTNVAVVSGVSTGGKYLGTVRGVSAGTSIVTVIAGSQSAKCRIKVGGGAGVVRVTSLTLNQTQARVEVGDEFDLFATVLPSNATHPEVTWKSSASSIASVNTLGHVVASKEGSTTITATADGKSAGCEVYVSKQGQLDMLSIYLDNTQLTLTVGDTKQLKATTSEPLTINWKSDNSSVVSITQSGVVSANKAGLATISATITKGDQVATATCSITVNEPTDVSDYESTFPQKNMAQPLHLYIHYLRENKDYDNWAVWIWQKKPKDYEGSLWGATHYEALENLEKGPIHSMTHHWMLDSETGGTSDTPYQDQFGQVLDIDLTRPDIVDGRDQLPSPLLDYEAYKASGALSVLRWGFLIVDQTKMDGGSHWTSDGGIESWIKGIDELLPNAESYIHIYCVEGSVSLFTLSSGVSVPKNPTIKDETGKYTSKDNIDNLKRDLYPSGVSTSETFLDDKPGVGYQIFVPSFADGDGDGNGDLKGIINKLDYLDQLGIKCLWLTPIQESASYHGYDVTDYYKIDSKFGTLEDYQRLIFEAHQRGMKVLMDMVINHTSKSNVLFGKSQRAEEETINGKKIEYRNMYHWRFEGEKVRTWDGVKPNPESAPANYEFVNVENDHDWYRDGDSKYFYFGKFGSGMAELNYSYQGTRDYMTDMCKYWLSFGLDGFRLDAVKHIYLESELDEVNASKYSTNPEGIRYDVDYRTYYDNELKEIVTAKNDYSYNIDLNVKFWKEFSGTIKAAYPNCFLVGENFDGYNKRIAPFYDALDSQFDFSTYYHLNEMGEASIASDVQTTLQLNDAYRKDHINGAFTSNHDVARMLNHSASTELKVHSVEVNSSNATKAIQRAKYYSTVTILSPGLSWIYYGDELGMSGNTQDEVYDEEGKKVDDHGNNIDRWYRQPMRWSRTRGENGVPKYHFANLEVLWDNYNKDLPTVSEQLSDPNSLLNHFIELGRIKSLPTFPTYGRIVWGGSAGISQSGSYKISDGTNAVIVLFNNTGSSIPVESHNQGAYMGGSVGSTATTIAPYGFVVVKTSV